MLPKPYERRWALARALQEGGLYVLCVLLPFSKASVEIAFGVMLLGWLLEHAGPGGWRRSIWSHSAARPVLLALGGYLAACALSIPMSTFPELSLRGFICKTVEYALFFMIVADFVQRRQVARRCVFLLLAASLLVVGDALWQQGFGRDLARGYRLGIYGRITGPYQNPNDLATYLITIICLALGELALATRWRRVWIAGVLLLATGCLILTAAHGAWIGLATAVMAMACLHRQLRAWALLLGGMMGLFAAVFRQMIRDPFVVGLRDRLFMWQTAWDMWRDHPLVGQGLNTFMANYLTYWRGGERTPRYAHNCYLQTAAETGLIGLAGFCWFLGAALAMVVQGIRRSLDAGRRCFLLGLFGSLVAFLVQAAVDTNFYSLRQAALFWTLAGVAVGYAWSPDDSVVAPVAEPAPAGVL